MATSTPASASAEPLVGVEPAAQPRLPGLRRRLVRSPAALAGLVTSGLLLAVAALADLLAPYDPLVPVGPPLHPPSAAHWMGTDGLGRDLLSGVVHGTRTSLYVAVTVALLTFLIGGLVGAVSGYVGGRTDDALMRGTELVQVLPRFFLAIVVIALLGPGTDRLVLVLAVSSWPLLGRVVRAEVLSLREREFVEAAHAVGASHARVLLRHVLPNALPASLVYLGLVVAQVVLIEASLGFLGLGDPNVVSWGSLAGQAQRYLRAAWWLSFFPGAAIVVAVLGINLLIDGLNDVLARRS